MRRLKMGTPLGITFAAICLVVSGFSQSNPEVKNILEKNIDAAGGQSRISEIQNYSYTSGGRNVFLSSTGVRKLTAGKEPIITEVILASAKGAGEVRLIFGVFYRLCSS